MHIKNFLFISYPVLADEINRTPPKTQAALLEAMQEHSVTAGRTTYTLNEPFFVLATQNPIELEGTYPLPEAQLDRFMFNINIDYLTEDDEVSVATATTSAQTVDVQTILTDEDVHKYQSIVRQVLVSEQVARYAVQIASHSRPTYDLPKRCRADSYSRPIFKDQSVCAQGGTFCSAEAPRGALLDHDLQT